MTITVLSKPSCPPCWSTKTKLDRLGILYDDIDMSTDPEALALAKSLGHLESPVVIVRDDNGTIQSHWSGLRVDNIEALAYLVAAS